MVLRPPVAPMLAQAAETIPVPPRPGPGLAYEYKFDGHRLLVFTPDGPGGRVLLQTRRGALVQDAFPDLVTAAAQLPDGLVLDGEVLAWDVEADALSFEGLQRRAAARARNAPALAARLPALYVAFDILMADGTELLTLPYEERRRRLEVLFAARALTSPWTLCPMPPGRRPRRRLAPPGALQAAARGHGPRGCSGFRGGGPEPPAASLRAWAV
ncbi:hypothetical protein AB0C86_35910 [Streptomyces lavendulae]|uniref:ATP-dependent DNA ligase n=1 Tax=Streptomyces lavendulae TaxID=1914 RepID=UPI0033F31F4C